MNQYVVAIYLPDNYDPSLEDEAMSRDFAALNDEMKAARVRICVGGLSPARSARSLRAQPGGKVLVTDPPHTETRLKRFYRRKLVKKGLGKARGAVARKLGIRLWIMLRDEIDYEEFCRRGQKQNGEACAGMPETRMVSVHRLNLY